MRKAFNFQLPDLITTRRLLVRPAGNNHDFSLMADFFNAALQDYPHHHMRWPMYDDPYRASEMRMITQNLNQDTARDHYIFLKGNSCIIGSMTYSKDRLGSPRMAYYITPEYRRLGYGGEAHSACLNAFMRVNSAVKTVWGEAEPHNKVSQKILIKNGFKKMGKRRSTMPGLESLEVMSLRYSR